MPRPIAVCRWRPRRERCPTSRVDHIATAVERLRAAGVDAVIATAGWSFGARSLASTWGFSDACGARGARSWTVPAGRSRRRTLADVAASASVLDAVEVGSVAPSGPRSPGSPTRALVRGRARRGARSRDDDARPRRPLPTSKPLVCAWAVRRHRWSVAVAGLHLRRASGCSSGSSCHRGPIRTRDYGCIADGRTARGRLLQVHGCSSRCPRDDAGSLGWCVAHAGRRIPQLRRRDGFARSPSRLTATDRGGASGADAGLRHARPVSRVIAETARRSTGTRGRPGASSAPRAWGRCARTASCEGVGPTRRCSGACGATGRRPRRRSSSAAGAADAGDATFPLFLQALGAGAGQRRARRGPGRGHPHGAQTLRPRPRCSG